MRLSFGLLVALPAAARVHDEAVTLVAGEAVPLKTLFKSDAPYRVTVRGVITLTVSNVPITIDPLFSFTGACQNASARVGVRLLNVQGVDVFSPFSAVPAPKCCSDHTYTFTLNGPTPRTGVLDGRITAKNDITVKAARGDTASGAFKLQITSLADPRRDVRFKVVAKKESRASAKDPLLADVRLSGAGRIADLDGARTARGLFQLTLVWLTRDDTLLTVKPTGTWRCIKDKRAVYGPVRVVKSSGTCLKPRRMILTLTKRRGTASLSLNDCNGLDRAQWLPKPSDIALSVQEVRVGG